MQRDKQSFNVACNVISKANFTLPDRLMVGRRSLEAKIGVRIPVRQPTFAKATEWLYQNTTCTFFLVQNLVVFIMVILRTSNNELNNIILDYLKQLNQESLGSLCGMQDLKIKEKQKILNCI